MAKVIHSTVAPEGEELNSAPARQNEIDRLLLNFERYLRLQKRRSSRTVGAYLEVVKRWMEHSDGSALMALGSVRAFLREAAPKLAPASQAQWASALKCFIQWGLNENDARFSQALLKEITRPRVPKKMIQVLDEEDLPLLLKTMQSRPRHEQLLFELLYGSGLRISEANQLTLAHFHSEAGELLVKGKGSRHRRVPLSPHALEIIDELQSKSLPSGASPKNLAKRSLWPEGTSVRTMRKWVEIWGEISLLSERTGRLHPHKLRHSLATHLLRRGGRLPQIQKLLGHKRLGTTERYTHLNTDDLIRVYDKAFPKLRKAIEDFDNEDEGDETG